MEISRMNIFLSCPPIYTLSGTWNDPEKIARCNDTLIPHGHLGQGAGFAVFFGLIVLGLVVYGIYMTFGSGGNDLRDEIREHARMHELGIAHGHEGDHPIMTQKAQEQDYPQHKHKV